MAPQLVVAQDRLFEHLYDDLARARERVVIYSPFMTQHRVGRLEPHLRAVVERGAEVWAITKTLEERSSDRTVYAEIEQVLRNWGVRVVHKRGMHEKLVMIDGEVPWQGSLNPLSFSSAQEIMERRASQEIVADYTRVLRLDELLAAYRANETTCPYCGGEVVAAEGPSEPYYWRCVEDGCFTRSIGDPMPVDGRVICHTCGGPLEFRWPNANPFWRCTDNHRHRQPIARTHLRLPRMSELAGKRAPRLSWRGTWPNGQASTALSPRARSSVRRRSRNAEPSIGARPKNRPGGYDPEPPDPALCRARGTSAARDSSLYPPRIEALIWLQIDRFDEAIGGRR